jgi:hypothetical protein
VMASVTVEINRKIWGWLGKRGLLKARGIA